MTHRLDIPLRGAGLRAGACAAMRATVYAAMCVGMIAGAGSASAALAIGEGAAPPSPRAVTAAPTGPAGGASVEWIVGVIDAVDPVRRTLTLRGKPVTLHATRLQVFDGAGPPSGAMSSLRAGMHIRFALEPGHAPDRSIVLVAIDRQP